MYWQTRRSDGEAIRKMGLCVRWTWWWCWWVWGTMFVWWSDSWCLRRWFRARLRGRVAYGAKNVLCSGRAGSEERQTSDSYSVFRSLAVVRAERKGLSLVDEIRDSRLDGRCCWRCQWMIQHRVRIVGWNHVWRVGWRKVRWVDEWGRTSSCVRREDAAVSVWRVLSCAVWKPERIRSEIQYGIIGRTFGARRGLYSGEQPDSSRSLRLRPPRLPPLPFSWDLLVHALHCLNFAGAHQPLTTPSSRTVWQRPPPILYSFPARSGITTVDTANHWLCNMAGILLGRWHSSLRPSLIGRLSPERVGAEKASFHASSVLPLFDFTRV